jgi:hypothetical protein
MPGMGPDFEVRDAGVAAKARSSCVTSPGRKSIGLTTR